MKKSMDLFGEALLAYSYGDRSKFYFGAASGRKYHHPLNQYFRTPNKFTKIEKKIISLSRGNILDVGCGTGLYIPSLMKKGKVLGIDISAKVIQTTRNNKLNNCIVSDIFKFKPKIKFDTIVLLENNLGIAETLPRARILLQKLSDMLSPKGCIMTNAMNVPRGTYLIREIYPIFKNKAGGKFKWISFNSKFLSQLCEEVGLKLEVIERSRYSYLARITKM